MIEHLVDIALARTRTAASSGRMNDHQVGSVWLKSLAEVSIGQVSISLSYPTGLRMFLGGIGDSGYVNGGLVGLQPVASDNKLALTPSPISLAIGGKTGDTPGTCFEREL